MVKISKPECDPTLLPKHSPPRLAQLLRMERKPFRGSAEKKKRVSYTFLNQVETLPLFLKRYCPRLKVY